MTNEEMVAVFERRFDQIDQRFDQLEQRMEDRFEQVDKRFVQIDERFARVDERFTKVGDDLHRTRVLFEQLEKKVDQIVDASVNTEQKLDRFRKETNDNFTELRERVTLLETSRH